MMSYWPVSDTVGQLWKPIAAAAVLVLFGGVESYSRNIRSINDGWRFRMEGDSVGVAVNLPHCWNSDAYQSRDYYRGRGSYSRPLEVTLPVGDDMAQRPRVYLKFDGAATESAVYIDGRQAGSHIGAYSSHTLDITDFIVPDRQQLLEVRVDNSNPEIPPYSADFTFMGGLYRDAWLITTPSVHFDIVSGPEDGFKVTTRTDGNGKWELVGSASLVNHTEADVPIVVTLSLTSPDGFELARTANTVMIKGEGRLEEEIALSGLTDISPWSPEAPTLYKARVTIEQEGTTLESAETNVGFRTFSFDSDGRFILNGSPCKLRGVCRHQDQRPVGIALSDDQHRRDIRLAKDLGANFIRISHYPQDDAVLEMCDRMGLVVWEEIPVIDYVPESGTFADNCETMFHEMIRRHYNHPSIVMWGYMNEILLRTPGEQREVTYRRTEELARRLQKVLVEEDTTRLTTMALHGSDVYHSAGLSDLTDVIGWNLYQGWYGGVFSDFENYLSRQHREHPSHRLIVSEYGAGSDLRLHSFEPRPFDFSMEYQQQYLEHYLPVIEDSVFVAGASHWNLIDFSSANRAESMPRINNKGLLTNERRKKDVYFYYKAAWHNPDSIPVAWIAVRDWPKRRGIMIDGEAVVHPVKVYTNLDKVGLKVNNIDLGLRPVVNYNALFDVPLVDGVNTLSLYDSRDELLDVATVSLEAVKARDGVIDPGLGELAINVGSNCYFRSSETGLEWIPDAEWSTGSLYGHVGGKPVETQDEIMLTGDGPLLQRSLSGLEEYRVAVVPGEYEVELLFADLSSPSGSSAYMLGRNSAGSEGYAAMDIFINGRQVEDGFMPARSNGLKSLVKKRYSTRAEGREGIVISLRPAGDKASTLLSALKIRKK